MNEEKPLTESESLTLIESMISKARNQFTEGGHLYLLWGWVVFVCSAGQFILTQFFHYRYNYGIWFLTWLAFIYQIIYMNRRKKARRVKTYTDEVLGYVWFTFIIAMFLISFVIGSSLRADTYKIIYPVFLTIYGVPSFLSGAMLRFKPLQIGGICCWLLALSAVVIPYQYHLLLVAAAMVVAWIIPGYLLQSRFRAQNQYRP